MQELKITMKSLVGVGWLVGWWCRVYM
jgi:hypothetical protein